jgi:long-chain acyl-CoA synthetase
MYLTQGLHRALQQHPDKLATVFGGRRHSYRQFVGRVAQLAGALQALGVAAGDRVAMLAHNSDRYLEYFFAVWWAGAVANPINTRWSVAEIVYALNDCQAGVLLVDGAFAPLAHDIRRKTGCVRSVIHAGEAATPADMLAYEAIIAAAQAPEDARRRGDDVAAILYTGGTTGFPKGVMLSHANCWSSSVARMAEVNNFPDGVTLIVVPLFHVAGMGRMINHAVIGGSSVILPGFRADNVLATLEAERIHDLVLVPSMLQMLLDAASFPTRRLVHLKRIVYGAAPMPQALLERAIDALPGVEFLHTYGMTETAASVCVNNDHGPQARASGLVRSAGRAGYGAEVRIVDSEGREVPRGTVGEIAVSGPIVMLGYWNKPEETRAALRDGWFYTGDGARMDDAGNIYVVDRLKDMIISGGENVYSAEVEHVIVQLAGVAACAVIGVPSAQWGEEVHAVVVPREGAAIDEQLIRTHCRALLAGYKCPKSIEFRSALPMSAAGKVLKNALREPYWRNLHGKDST